MERWTRFVLRHRWIVLGAWLVVFLVAGFASSRLADLLTNRFTPTFLLPMRAFGSVLPLQAIALNLLSIGAAYGLLVIVFSCSSSAGCARSGTTERPTRRPSSAG